MAGTSPQPEVERGTAAVTARCAVLAPAAASVPVELLEGLTRRGMVSSVVSDPPSVMVALGRGDTAAVVLVDRDRLAHVDALISAIRRYHPRTMIWAFEPGEDGGSRLARINGRAHASATIPAPEHARPGPRSRNGEFRSSRSPVPGTPSGLAAGREHEQPLISQEELEMLLGHSVDPAEAEAGSAERGGTP